MNLPEKNCNECAAIQINSLRERLDRLSEFYDLNCKKRGLICLPKVRIGEGIKEVKGGQHK